MPWDGSKSTASDPDNPTAAEQLTAAEWNQHVTDGHFPADELNLGVNGSGNPVLTDPQNGDAEVLEYDRSAGQWVLSSLTIEDLITDSLPEVRIYSIGSTYKAADPDSDSLIDTDTDFATVYNSVISGLSEAEIVIERGTHAVSKALSVDNKFYTRGAGPLGSTILELADGVDDHMFKYTDSARLQWWGLERLWLDGNSANNTGSEGIHLVPSDTSQVKDIRVVDVFTSDFANRGFQVKNAWGCIFERHISEDNGTDGGWINSTDAGSASKLIGCKMNSNGQHGLRSSNQEIIVDDSEFSLNQDRGIWVAGGDRQKIHDCNFNKNSRDAADDADIFIGGGSRHSVDGCTFLHGQQTAAIDVAFSTRVGVSIGDGNTYQGYSPAVIDDGTKTKINGVVTGTYTGDGTATQSIALDFRPRVVLVEESGGTLYETRDDGLSLIDGSDPPGGASDLTITDDGFDVGNGTGDQDPNTDGETYTFRVEE